MPWAMWADTRAARGLVLIIIRARPPANLSLTPLKSSRGRINVCPAAFRLHSPSFYLGYILTSRKLLCVTSLWKLKGEIMLLICDITIFFVGLPSPPLSPHTCALILVSALIDAKCVLGDLPTAPLWPNTCELTQERNHTNVRFVNLSFPNQEIWIDTCVYTNTACKQASFFQAELIRPQIQYCLHHV